MQMAISVVGVVFCFCVLRVPERELGATFESSSCQLRVDGPNSSTPLGPTECGAVRW
jgi:hypothetical protein